MGTIWPTFQTASDPGLAFTSVVAIIFALGVGWIAHRGVNGSTAVNIAINIIQISALLVFSVMLLSYRISHKPGSEAWQFDSVSGEAYSYEFATTTWLAPTPSRAMPTTFRNPSWIRLASRFPSTSAIPRLTTKACS